MSEHENWPIVPVDESTEGSALPWEVPTDDADVVDGNGFHAPAEGWLPKEPVPVEPAASLSSLLVANGVVSEEQVRQAFADGIREHKRLGEIVLSRGWVDELGLARVISEQWALPLIADTELELDADAGTHLSLEQAQRLQACVLGYRAGCLLVAVVDPSVQRFSEIRAALQQDAAFAVTTPSLLARLLARLAGADATRPLLALGGSVSLDSLQRDHAPANESEGAEASRRASDANTGTHEGASDGRETKALLELFDETIERLNEFRSHVEHLSQAQLAASRELHDCRQHLATLADDRNREEKRADELSEELARHHATLASLRSALDAADATSTGE